jgi:hypothetical protein
MSEPTNRATVPVRSAGVRIEYALAGAVLGALIGLVVGLLVTVTLTKLGTIANPTGSGLGALTGIGAIIGAARGSAVSTRIVRAGLRITNPLRRYTLPADQIAKIVSVPASSGRRGATLGVMLADSYVQIPIRALRLPALGQGRSRPAAPFADIARWAHANDIPFRASAEEWNALLRAGAVRASD